MVCRMIPAGKRRAPTFALLVPRMCIRADESKRTKTENKKQKARAFDGMLVSSLGRGLLDRKLVVFAAGAHIFCRLAAEGML